MTQIFLISHGLKGGKTKDNLRSKASAQKTANIVLEKLGLAEKIPLDKNNSKKGLKDRISWTSDTKITETSICVKIVFSKPVTDLTKSVEQGGFGFYPFLRIIEE